MTTAAYRTAILAGVTSAVSRGAPGWWLEVSIDKRVLSPAISGPFGVDFNFRDNDENNGPDDGLHLERLGAGRGHSGQHAFRGPSE